MTTATYSPEDNKLRIYPDGERLDDLLGDEYADFKRAGYKWAAKQECFVCPRWTPTAEDWALRLCGEIDDEDYSPEERSADRAERFSGYREKRAGEAGDFANRFDAGPSAFGHQNARRAERQAKRHDRLRVGAVSQWSKAEYWQERTAGVIAHALYRSSPEVRRGRILAIEADLRKCVAQYTPQNDPPQIINKQVYSFSQRKYLYDGAEVPHVLCGSKGRGCTLVVLSQLEAIKAGYARWVAHYELRLAYERAMLGDEGGTAADAEMEVGGWIGSHQIQKVNKSKATGKVVSVTLSSGVFNIQRLPEGAYRAPTDEERAQFDEETKARKAKEKAAKPKAAPLINPTDEDAEKLQAIWNAQAANGRKTPPPESKIVRLTQAEYSARSKGTYAHYSTAEISEQLKERYTGTMRQDRAGRVTVFKTRRTSSGGFDYGADRVVIITDKPRSAIPWDAVEAEAANQPTVEKMLPKLDEIAAAVRLDWLPERDTAEYKLLSDAEYLGWVYIGSMTQFSWTEEGAAIFKEYTQPVAA